MRKETLGAIYVTSAYIIWGVLPLYWNLLKRINSAEILAHRVLWAFLFFLFVNFLKGNTEQIKKVLKEKDKLKLIAMSSFLLGFNWFLYVWAVTHGKVIEASMGYYINPIFSIILGVFFLKEKLNKLQLFAFFLALTGVFVMIIGYGKVPWVAIGLMLLFGFYGLTKKVSKIDSLVSLNLETLFILPFILYLLIIFRVRQMQATPFNSLYYLLLLIIGGILTAIPIYLFSAGVKLIKLSYVGFFQYISPSLNLIVGVFILKERFGTVHFISFSFIWVSLILFIFSNLKKKNQAEIIKEEFFIE